VKFRIIECARQKTKDGGHFLKIFYQVQKKIGWNKWKTVTYFDRENTLPWSTDEFETQEKAEKWVKNELARLDVVAMEYDKIVKEFK
jgi:hypothetical protein